MQNRNFSVTFLHMSRVSDNRALLALEDAPTIAHTTVEEVNRVVERIEERADQVATGFGPSALSDTREALLGYLKDFAALRHEVDSFLRVMVSYAIETQMLPQRQVADAAGIALHTAQSWAAANKRITDEYVSDLVDADEDQRVEEHILETRMDRESRKSAEGLHE